MGKTTLFDIRKIANYKKLVLFSITTPLAENLKGLDVLEWLEITAFVHFLNVNKNYCKRNRQILSCKRILPFSPDYLTEQLHLPAATNY
jgi:hypothetical protein